VSINQLRTYEALKSWFLQSSPLRSPKMLAGALGVLDVYTKEISEQVFLFG
jgi:hypothetical protein